MYRILGFSAALCAVQAIGALAQDIPTCVAQCASQVQADFPKFSCANAQDAGCLCPSIDFNNGIRSCALDGCLATETDVFNYLTSPTGFCLAVPPPAPAAEEPSDIPSSAAPEPTEAVTESPTPEPEPTTTPEPSTVSEPLETTSEPAPETTAAPTTTEITTAPPSTTSSSSSQPTETSTESTPVPTPAADDDDDDEDDKDEDEDEDKDDEGGSGLSSAASIGIGVGVGALAIAIVGVGLCLFMRNRRRQNHTGQSTIEISRPIPTGGDYPRKDHGTYEKYDNDIELTTNRYDDMPPRQEPRTMV